MIENDDAAKRMTLAANQACLLLDESAALARRHGTAAQAEDYCIRVGTIIYEITARLLDPIYQMHPQLKPPGWDDQVC